MLYRIARLAVEFPRRVIAVAILAMIAAVIFGVPVIQHLSGGGGTDPGSESSKATALLSQKFDQGDMTLVIAVTSPDGAHDRKPPPSAPISFGDSRIRRMSAR